MVFDIIGGVLGNVQKLIPVVRLPSVQLPQAPQPKINLSQILAAPRQASQIVQRTKAPEPVKQLFRATVPVTQQLGRLTAKPATVMRVAPLVTNPLGAIQTIKEVRDIPFHTKELVLNEKYGTVWDESTAEIDPYGKAAARLGASPPFADTTKVLRDAFMEYFWKPKIAAETTIGEGLRRSPVPGAKQTLGALQYTRDFIGYDVPENVAADILPDIISIGGSKTLKAAKVVKALSATEGGTDMVTAKGIGKLFGDAVDVYKRFSAPTPVRKVVNAPTPKPSVPVTTPKKVVTAPRVAAPATPTPKNRIKQAIANLNANRQYQRQVKNIAEQQQAYKRIVADQQDALVQIQKQADALRRTDEAAQSRFAMQSLDDTRLDKIPTRLNIVDDVGSVKSRGMSAIDDELMGARNALSDLADRARAVNPAAATSSFADKAKLVLGGALVGTAGTIGGMTLMGLLFPEAQVEVPGPQVDPNVTNQGQVDPYGGAWGDYGGYPFWNPSTEQEALLPDSVMDDLGTDGLIGFDENGDPYGIYGSDGQLIRTLTDEEKAAMEGLVDESMPTTYKTKSWLNGNWPLVVVGIGLAGAGTYYYYYKKNNGMIGNRSTGYRSTIAQRRKSIWS